MNPFEILKNAKELNSHLESMKTEIENTVVEGASGGGLVKIVLTGDFRVKSVFLDPIAVDNRDVAMLQDLIRAAHTDAWNKLKKELESKFGKLATGFSL